VGKLQRYCSAPACTKVKKSKSDAIWREKMLARYGKEFFDDRNRVREWRELNPNYWRRLKRFKGRRRPRFVLAKYQLSVLRFDALQANFDTLVTLGNELVAILPTVALQDSMAKKLRAARLRGREILRTISEESTH
jgi:hypothetical protein